MAIQYDAKTKTLTLHTAHTTYQMKVGKFGHLLHTYYGPRAEGDLSFGIQLADHGFSANPPEAAYERNYSMDVLPQEYPCSGNGDFRHPAFSMRRRDGASGCDLRYRGHHMEAGKYNLGEMPTVYAGDSKAETLRVTLGDQGSGVEVELRYAVLPELDVITRCAIVKNTGSKEIVIQNAASAALDFLGGDWELLHFWGRHEGERTAERTPIGHSEVNLCSRRGTSSHQHNPFVILCDKGTTEDFGTAIGVSLLWSGGFACRAGRDQFDQTRLTLGLQDEGLDYILKPGETLVTPEAVLCLTEGGFSDLSHKFHDLTRKHICRGPWRDKRRPILINNWEATYADFTGKQLLDIAAQASQLGVELFVLDDGWFGARNNDDAGLGDWVVNEKKLGMTMGELSRRINAMGMEFGLWIEPEMVNMDSDLYRTHPDWALHIPGKGAVLGRNQLVLDFSRPEVVEAVFDQISAVLDSANVSYIKMDMNRSVCELYSDGMGSQSSGMVAYRYMLGVYRFMDMLLGRYPGLLLEGCSGGGGRFDHGMLCYCPQIWCSDNTDAIERTRIQYGTSFGYPVSAVGAHVSASPNHQTGRATPLNTRAVAAMAGSFGYELDLKLLSQAEKQEVTREIEDFKQYWDVLHNGSYYRLTDAVNDRRKAAWMMVSQDKREALVNIVSLDNHGNDSAVLIRLRGLEASASYRDDTGRTYSGAALMAMGLPMARELGEYRAWQIHLTKI